MRRFRGRALLVAGCLVAAGAIGPVAPGVAGTAPKPPKATETAKPPKATETAKPPTAAKPPEAAETAKKPKKPTRVVLSVSVGPQRWVAGAQVRVWDRSRLRFRGVTNAAGHLSFRVGGIKKKDWPLRVETTGGLVDGRAFGGHLRGWVWGAGTESLGLWSTSASIIAATSGKKNSKKTKPPSPAAWSAAVEKVRRALGIDPDAGLGVLDAGNFYVDGTRVDQRVAALGGYPSLAYDRLAAQVAAAATAKPGKRRAITSLGLAPASGSIVMGGPTLTGSQAGTDQAPCGAIQPDTPAPAGKSAGFWVAVVAGAALGLAWNLEGEAALKLLGFTDKTVTTNGFLDALDGGYYMGTIFGWGQSSGESQDQAQLTAIQTQLTCISGQIAAVQGAVTDLSNKETVYEIMEAAGANACASSVTSGMTAADTGYLGAVKAAVPQTVAVDGVTAGGQLQVPISYSLNFGTGTTVTGDGIPVVYLGGNTSRGAPSKTFKTSSPAAPGSNQVQFSDSVFSSGFSTALLRGQRVSGTGVGVNADGSAALVTAVLDFQGVTTLTLSAPTTASIPAGTALAIAAPNTVTSTSVSGGVMTVSLAAPADASALSVTVAASLDVASQLVPDQAQTWDVGDCVGTVDRALFGESSYGQSGFAAYVDYVTQQGGGVGTTMTPAQVEQVQQFLEYWALVEVQAFILGVEYDSYMGNIDNAVQTLSGFSPVLAADGTPVCWDTAATSSACYALSHVASAWPDMLYSDEIGQVSPNASQMVAVSGFPGGFVVPEVDQQWNLSRGATTLNPVAWLALYWQLGANAACVPEFWGAKVRGTIINTQIVNSEYPYNPYWDCPLVGAFDATWTAVAVNASEITVSGAGTLNSTGIYSSQTGIGSRLFGAPASATTDATTGCGLGRPYYSSAQCLSNAPGFNPAGYDSPTTTYPHGAAALTAGSPVVTTPSAHGLSPGDPVQFWGADGLPAGVQAGTVYSVASAGFTATTFEAEDAGGNRVTPGTGCPSGCYFASTAAQQSSVANAVQNYQSQKAAHTLSLSSTELASNDDDQISQTGILLAGMQCMGSIPDASATATSASGDALFSWTVPKNGLGVDEGQALVFWSSAGGVTAGEVYYVVNSTQVTTAGTQTFNVATAPGGTAIGYTGSSVTVSFNSTQCPRQDASGGLVNQDAGLLGKDSTDAGFFTSDGSVTQYLWYGLPAHGDCQGDQGYLYPQQYSYAYSNYTNQFLTTAGLTVQLPTSLSQITAGDLSNGPLPFGANCSLNNGNLDPPHTCWAQGAMNPAGDYYETSDGLGSSTHALSGATVQTCAAPFYYTKANFTQSTDLNDADYDSERFDSFVLGRTWWPALPGLLTGGPPDPLTVECNDQACDNYAITNSPLVAPSGSYGTPFVSVSTAGGEATVSWAQPQSAGTGSITGYSVAADGWTCAVANPDPTTGNSTTTFATCTGGSGTPAVTVTATNTVGSTATATTASTQWAPLATGSAPTGERPHAR